MIAGAKLRQNIPVSGLRKCNWWTKHGRCIMRKHGRCTLMKQNIILPPTIFWKLFGTNPSGKDTSLLYTPRKLSCLKMPKMHLTEENQNSDNHRNFQHFVGTFYTFILVWPSTSCRKKLKTSDGGRNFRPWVGTSDQHWAAELVKCVENCRKINKNAKLILLASYFHALYDRTMKCVVWQLFLCSFIYARWNAFIVC